MAIKVDKYNFKGIEIPNAVIKVNRLFGSKQEGWNSLVGVYHITTEEVEATEEAESTTRTLHNKLEEFNHSCAYTADERGYVSMYTSLMDKFGGEEI